MNFKTSAALIGTLVLPLAVQAQNITIVNGKPVPKARVERCSGQKQAAHAASRLRPNSTAGKRQGRASTRSSCRRPRSAASPPRPTSRRRWRWRARHPDRRCFAELRQDEPGHRRRRPGRIRQVQGAGDRHRIPRAPHPGREGRRRQGADRPDQGRRQVRGPGQEELEGPGLGDERRRPRLRQRRRPTCPSSRRRWSS